ncbi:long chain fatty acid elongation enzyme, putative [Plasmodium sp. DRC-Itaito]|nr:long chain fatty acid elongation enzyme, putative [Plasmodium sp. DRC-Itaito]
MSIINKYYWTPQKGRELAIKYEKIILMISLLYIPCILMLQRIMKHRKEKNMKYLKILWNLSLSLLSFIGVLLITIYDKNILKYIIVEESEYSPETRAVISIFTLTKVVEYGDTIFLILKKKKLTFLHSYHHLSVVLYCLYSQKILVSHAHYFVLLNLLVHSIMYFYFAFIYIFPHILIKIRKFITCLQIFQMFAGIYISYYAIKNVDNPLFVSNAIGSFILYLSYAVLFLNFYFSNYYRNIKSNVATYLISVHILAIIGFIMICKSKDILRLFIEVSIGSFFTLTLLNLSFYINKHYYQNVRNRIIHNNMTEEKILLRRYKTKYYSNMALLKIITIKLIKTILLCFNGIATYAHDHIFLFVNFYSQKIKQMTNDSVHDVNGKNEDSKIYSDNKTYDFDKIYNKEKNENDESLHNDDLQKGIRNVSDQRTYRHRNNNNHHHNNNMNYYGVHNIYEQNKNNKINYIRTFIKNIYNSSIIFYIISKQPNEYILYPHLDNRKREKKKKVIDNSNTESTKLTTSSSSSSSISLKQTNKNINPFYIIKYIFKNYLFYIVSLILPIYYGLKVYNDALLGLCVHGALRWIIEIHSTKIFNKTGKIHSQ